MTETEWLTRHDPTQLLQLLGGRAGERKLRLFACAACRRIWPFLKDERSRRAVEVAELYADGRASTEELEEAGRAAREAAGEAARLAGVGWNAAQTAADTTDTPAAAAERAARMAADADLVREVFGNPFRTVNVDPAWLAWGGGTVVQLARVIYEERRFCDLPVLADALEDAGCGDPDILSHCRVPARHARGCWALDLMLARE
jgi:hypothetical protein